MTPENFPKKPPMACFGDFGERPGTAIWDRLPGLPEGPGCRRRIPCPECSLRQIPAGGPFPAIDGATLPGLRRRSSRPGNGPSGGTLAGNCWRSRHSRAGSLGISPWHRRGALIFSRLDQVSYGPDHLLLRPFRKSQVTDKHYATINQITIIQRTGNVENGETRP